MFYGKRKCQAFQCLTNLADLLIIDLIHSEHHCHGLRKALLELTCNVISWSLLWRDHSCHIHDTNCFPHRITTHVQSFCNVSLRRQFFSRTQSREFNLDILIDFIAWQPDHIPCKIKDLYRFSHIQDEDLSAFGIGTCLKYQWYRFRNRHKVADDLRMCDGYRSSFCNLFFK